MHVVCVCVCVRECECVCVYLFSFYVLLHFFHNFHFLLEKWNEPVYMGHDLCEISSYSLHMCTTQCARISDLTMLILMYKWWCMCVCACAALCCYAQSKLWLRFGFYFCMCISSLCSLYNLLNMCCLKHYHKN